MKNHSKRTRNITTLNRKSNGLVTLTSNPVWRALSKKPITEESRISIGLPARKALYAISNNFGNEDHFIELMMASYTGLILAEQGYGEDYIFIFSHSVNILLDFYATVKKKESFIISTQEKNDLSEMLNLYEQQISLASKDSFTSATLDAYCRISDLPE